MEFCLLEWCTPKFGSNETGLGKTHELSWIIKLHSLTPLGINQHVGAMGIFYNLCTQDYFLITNIIFAKKHIFVSHLIE